MAGPAKQQLLSRRVAIFGGSFDPVHRGHLAMAALAHEVAELEEVLFMPAAVSPFKKGTVATAAQRFEMIVIALDDAGMDWAGVSDFELNRPAPSYSWETAHHFHALEPETEWCWILGTDQWEQIDRWAGPERLREGLHFLVFTRKGQTVRDRPGWRHTPIALEHPASSTAIRGDIAGHRDWLTPGVAAYCGEERIYGSL
jgi:nicotinate-nucleotide adenylyltransferase